MICATTAESMMLLGVNKVKLFRWAFYLANIFINSGCKVYLFRNNCPTPLLAFGVRHCKTALGVMITASHNPKEDNGYKVYWK